MTTTTKVILSIIGVLGVGALIYFLAKPKEIAKPVVNTGSGNALNVNVSPFGSSFGLTGNNESGVPVVNGMTQAEYLAAGYSQADVNLLFS